MKTVDLIEFLTLETEKHVSAYKEDLQIDKRAILESQPGQSYIWAARENGTHLWDAEHILWKKHFKREIVFTVLRLWHLKAIYRIEVKDIQGEQAFGVIEELSLDVFKKVMREDVKTPTFKEKLLALSKEFSDSRSLWEKKSVDEEKMLVSKIFGFFFHNEIPKGLLQTYIPRAEALAYVQKNLK